MTLPPRVVVVVRESDYRMLVRRHSTAAAAAFFLQTRGQTLEALRGIDDAQERATGQVLASIPLSWRRNRVMRDALDRFLFEPEDVVVVVGQDGLVANVAKYLDGQPVIGVNPQPGRYEGVLVPWRVAEICRVLERRQAPGLPRCARTMVRATLDDGQTVDALNEVFVGHRSHQSARYEIVHAGRSATHSSSGVIVATGTGATGWARALVRAREGWASTLPEPGDRGLAYFVREAFPSVASSVDLTEGSVGETMPLELVSRMNDGGVLFGDGIEQDCLGFDWGRRVSITVAPRSLEWVPAP